MTNKFLALGSIILLGSSAGARAEETNKAREASAELVGESHGFASGSYFRKFHLQSDTRLGVAQARKLMELELDNRTKSDLNANSDSINLLSASGQLALACRDAKKTVEYLSKSTALREKKGDTNDSAYFYDLAGLAEAYLALGDFDKAKEKFKRLIPLISPADDKGNIYRLDLAQTYADSGQTQAAEDLCDQVIASGLVQRPKASHLCGEITQIGEWYRKRKKYIKAEQCYIKAINSCASEWDKEQAEIDLLWCYIEQREIQKASILMKQYPVSIELSKDAYNLAFGNRLGFGAVFTLGSAGGIGPAGLRQYQAGLKALNLNRLKDAERRFRIALRSEQNTGRELSWLGLAKCCQLTRNEEGVINALADFRVIQNKW